MNILPINSKKRLNAKLKSFFVLFFMIFYIVQCIAQVNRKDIISRSNFIFTGTIIKMNASNIEVVADVPTAIVRVDEVVDAVSPYDEMKGKEITVLLTTAQNKKAGDKQVFYTSGWYYGKTLGVKEMPNRLLVSERPDALKKKIIAERINIRNDSLVDELKRAVSVVHGTVIESNINVEKIPFIESEHDPELKKAIIEIKEVLKGNVTGRRVEVYYAASDDVIWYSSPKLSKGQEAIFLLQLRQSPPIYKIKGYTLLDQRDVQPTENLVNVKTLLRNNR
jgi:hypothetical protein